MKGNRLLARFFFVPLGCLTLSYVTMCVYWLVTGCRYGVKVCTSVFVDSLPFTLIISGVAAAVSGTVAIKRIKRFSLAMEKCRKSSGAPEDIAQLDKALGALRYKGAYVSLLRASALLGCGCYDECLGELEGIDLAYLSAEDEEEYFNMLIYCRLMQGEKETALRLYLLSGHYFRRALGRRGTSHIRHTVGMIYYTVGEYDKALRLFEESKKDVERSLQTLFYIEALGSFDVFQIDTSEGGGDTLYGLAELLWVFLVDLNVEDVDAAVNLKQQAFTFHHGLAAQRTNITKSQHSGTIRDDGYQVTLVGILVSIVCVLLNLKAGIRHSRRICQR